MKILTLENKCFLLNNLPEELTDDVRFAVLDNSNPKEPDFFFIPLIFLESFSAPAMVLEIGGKEITMPVDWSLAVGDSNGAGEIEILPLTSLNDRGFDAFTFNPMSSSKLDFHPIDIVDIYTEVKWYFPKLKSGQLLAVPLNDKPKPQCAYFVSEINKQSEVIDVNQVM